MKILKFLICFKKAVFVLLVIVTFSNLLWNQVKTFINCFIVIVECWSRKLDTGSRSFLYHQRTCREKFLVSTVILYFQMSWNSIWSCTYKWITMSCLCWKKIRILCKRILTSNITFSGLVYSIRSLFVRLWTEHGIIVSLKISIK